MVDYSGLENRRAERHRGFESLSLRNQKELSNFAKLFFFALREVSHPSVGGSCSVSLCKRPMAERESLSLRKEFSKRWTLFFAFKRDVSPTGRGFLLRFPMQAAYGRARIPLSPQYRLKIKHLQNLHPILHL